MKGSLVLACIVSLALTLGANAAVKEGDTEIDLLAGWSNLNFEDNGDMDTFFLSSSVGYFLTNNIQVSGAFLGAWLDIDDIDMDVYGIGGKVKYHFRPENQYVPYIGAQIYWSKADVDIDNISEDEDGILWGPMVGLRYQLNEYNHFYVEYQYQMFQGGIDDFVDDGNLIVFGIVHRFK